MRNYTGNLLQFSESLPKNVTNKIQKNWHNIGSRFDFGLRFFLKAIFLEGVSLCKIKFHKSVDILLIYSWVIYLMHSSASQLQLIKHFQYSVSCFNNTHTHNSKGFQVLYIYLYIYSVPRKSTVCFHLFMSYYPMFKSTRKFSLWWSRSPWRRKNNFESFFILQ